MTCPYCGRKNPADAEYCLSCGYPLPQETKTGGRLHSRRARKTAAAAGRTIKIILLALLVVCSLFLFGWGWYKVHFWRQSTRLASVYTSGEMQIPTLEVVQLSDGRAGHQLTFYGKDGDMVYIEELGQSYMIVGGKADIQVADSEWFDLLPNDVEKAMITMLPVLMHEDGTRTELPGMSFEVETPQSPLAMIAPTQEKTIVLSAIYQLELKVVPGSTVLVDGSDVTDMVDILGNLSVNVNVFPQGDNPISILVRTPHHKETRTDIVLFREKTDINIELSIYTARSSTRSTMTVSGAVDPEAKLVVDSPYDAESLTVDENGNFSFWAQFEQIGINKVTFHAEKPGCQNAVISFDVNYLPTLSEYAKDAWRMDYDSLCQFYEIWEGHVYLCRGNAVEVYEDGVFLMDVGDGNLVAIRNMTKVNVTEGNRYALYADVHGMYDSVEGDIPYLIARYEKTD